MKHFSITESNMKSIFELYTFDVDVDHTHLLEENRHEETVIPKLIEVVEEFAQAEETTPATLSFDGAIHENEIIWSDDIIELDENDFEPIHEEISDEDIDAMEFNAFTEGDLFSQNSVAHTQGWKPSPMMQLVIDLDAERLSTVDDHPELDQEHRETASTERPDLSGIIPAVFPGYCYLTIEDMEIPF